MDNKRDENEHLEGCLGTCILGKTETVPCPNGFVTQKRTYYSDNGQVCKVLLDPCPQMPPISNNNPSDLTNS
jgi:hypothetical protein